MTAHSKVRMLGGVLVATVVAGLVGAQELQLGYGTKFGTQPGKVGGEVGYKR